ncbi:DUF1493 family protein [Pedobacter agri]|uniref:DUF1493 family protein n=1 Tax=Pedobacter agri TaxID=454586 RepID=UPI00292F3AF1|nr:DUF1493 family protein [Pedobacter agri]
MYLKYSQNHILNYVVRELGCSKDEVNLNSDLVKDLGCDGDDWDEFLTAFAKEFHVDMQSYLWYFHAKEEGMSLGGGVFRPPNERVKRIVITPTLLLQAANDGKWPVIYPEHKIPRKRYDLFINQFLLVLFILVLIYKCSR